DVNLTGSDEPQRVAGFIVSADFFPVLGVQPALGRMFAADEETPGRQRRAVLGYGLWQRRFGGDRSILGRTVLLDTEPYEIVGVAPRGFDFPMGSEIWAPLSFDAAAAAQRSARHLSIIGRLAPGRTLDDAKAQMAVIADRLAQQYPEANRDHSARVSTLLHGMRDEGLGPMLSLSQASAAFVLLIACANIANLLLARGAERQRDIAVRLAIGASRARLVRELLLESLVLALAAVPAAIGVAWLGIRLIRINMPPRLLRFVAGWDHLDVDGRLIAVTAMLAIGTAIVFGVFPALQASRPRLAETLKEGGRSATAGRHRQRLRRILVVAEIALSLPLLVASGLSIIGANRFLNGPQGYDPDGLLTLRAVLPDAGYADAAARRRFAADVVDRLSQMPGVLSAAATNSIPSGSSNSARAIDVDGRAAPDSANPPTVDYRTVTPGFFDTMRIAITQGRAFTSADREDAAAVAIVTESMAETYFPGTDPLGRRIKLGGGAWITIVGVSHDVIHDWFDHRRYPTVYRPHAQSPGSNVAFVVRAAGDPAALTTAAGRAVRTVDPSQPVFDVLPMRQVLYERTVGLQYIAAIMGVFAVLALGLAVVGVYSLMAFLMAQRAHEIGVRIALGASRGDVMRLAVGQAARLTCAGAAVGLVLATALGRLMEAGLLGIVSGDARVSFGFAGMLVLSALAGGYLPARRAAAIDPMAAVRSA
ncbi:MAG: ABC transporter permease, partial [Acidobacteriota bacterium]